jgi:hypothetical protein
VPIRTPRGRAAAYRSLWQWPLRSPARLVVTVAVVLGLAVGISTALGALRGPSGVAGTVPTSGAVSTPTVAPTPSVLPPVPTNAPTTAPVSSAPTEALDVARRWTQAWVRPPAGTTAQQWLDGLRPYTTEAYLGVLTAVDPANNPATRVTGIVRAVEVTAESVQVEVPTDAVELLVLVVLTEDGTWLVSGHEQAA